MMPTKKPTTRADSRRQPGKPGVGGGRALINNFCGGCSSLDIEQLLRYYQKRWSVEVDNTYLKNALGLGDICQQSFEAIQKWFAVVMVAINYLHYRMALAYIKNLSKASLADIIRQHRLEHFQKLLRTVLLPFANGHKSRPVYGMRFLYRLGQLLEPGFPRMILGRPIPAFPLCRPYD